MANPAPGFLKYPEYRVSIEPSTARVRAMVGDTLIADTHSALQVNETLHAPVWYLPMTDVDPQLIAPSSTRTHCPFKGDASYWNVCVGGRILTDAMWGYESPFDECLPLAGYVAFYSDRVTIAVTSDARQ